MFPSSAAKDDINNIKASANNLKNDVKSDVKSDLNDVANQAGRKVRSMIDSASEELAQVSDTVASEIRSNPVRSSVIALGIGVVLGALVRR